MYYTKLPLTLDAQAELLISRGMSGDKTMMVERLRMVGYYRLSAYWYPFREFAPQRNRLDTFKPGTNFDEVWSRYVFDRRLRLLVLDAIERIEVAIRTHLSYHHSHLHGRFAYANDPSSFENPRPQLYSQFLESIEIETAKSKEQFIRHFKTKYFEHTYLPVWMATEIMTFGTMMSMYQFCPPNVKNEVAKCVGLSSKILGSWLLTLNAVRNVCAHHGRLWNKELGVKPVIPKKRHSPNWHVPVEVPAGRIFAVLTFCHHALTIIAPQSRWPRRLRALLAAYPKIPLNEMGFPDRWYTNQIWASPTRIGRTRDNLQLIRRSIRSRW